jgi:hypothetical protein
MEKSLEIIMYAVTSSNFFFFMPATSYIEREREVNQFFSFGFPL